MLGTDSGLRDNLLTEAECTVHSSLKSWEVSEVRRAGPTGINVRRHFARSSHFHTGELGPEKAKGL